MSFNSSLKSDVNTVEPSCATTSRKRPPLISDPIILNAKIFQVKALKLKRPRKRLRTHCRMTAFLSIVSRGDWL